MKVDYEIVLEAVSGKYGRQVFEFVPEKYKDNREIALKAPQSNPWNTRAFEFVPDNLKKDTEIIKACKQGDFTIPRDS